MTNWHSNSKPTSETTLLAHAVCCLPVHQITGYKLNLSCCIKKGSRGIELVCRMWAWSCAQAYQDLCGTALTIASHMCMGFCLCPLKFIRSMYTANMRVFVLRHSLNKLHNFKTFHFIYAFFRFLKIKWSIALFKDIVYICLLSSNSEWLTNCIR